MTMDADPSDPNSAVVCAPKLVKVEGGYMQSYFANGACLLLKSKSKIAPLGRSGKTQNSNNNKLNVRLQFLVDQIDADPNPYYKYALAEMGMSLKYHSNKVFFGAPGLYSWSGKNRETNQNRKIFSFMSFRRFASNWVGWFFNHGFL